MPAPFWVAGLGERRHLLHYFPVTLFTHTNVYMSVVEGDLLVVPAKRRRSPSPATQNGAVLSE
jgi:hypothetical protein